MHWRMVALAVALFLALLLPVPAAAQSSGSISLSTYFTGVTVQGGQYVYTTVNVTNQMETPASISLSTSAPPGWSAVLTYNGYNVTAVYAPPGGTRSLRLAIYVPSSASPGTYEVNVTARSGQAVSNTLTFYVEVAAVPKSSQPITVSVSYPSLSGSPGSTLSYMFEVDNNLGTSAVATFSMDTPPGWAVTFLPSEYSTTVISGISMGPYSVNPGLVADVYIPSDAQPGIYNLTLTVTASGYRVSIPLTATVTGTYSYSLSTPGSLLSLNVQAGRTTTATVIVSNTGTEPLTSLTLVAVQPSSGWSVSLSPSTIQVLQPGQNSTVTLSVTPPPDAIPGVYALTVSAYSRQASSHSLTFLVTVTKQTYWGVVGVVVIVAAVAALIAVFWRFGRP
ncbi:MAG: COG1361 S-layer family protein [Conexivisphaera sp.]